MSIRKYESGYSIFFLKRRVELFIKS